MDERSGEFILANRHRLSLRQLAKATGIPRTDVERFIRKAKSEGLTKIPPDRVSRKTECLSLALIFFVALAVRLFYMFQLRATPFFEPLTRHIDDGVYDQMARQMAGGRWLADLPLSAYRIPLYPYFIALLYKLFGFRLIVVHLVQSFLGAVTAVMVAQLTKRAFNHPGTALLAGLWMAVYVPCIFFENLLVGESLSIFFSVIGLYIFMDVISAETVSKKKCAASGFLFGLTILLRPNFVVPVFCIAIYALYTWTVRSRLMRSAALLVVFLGGMFLALAPISVRNYYLHRDFIPLSAVGGINFYIGNNPGADGKLCLVKGIGTNLDKMIGNSEEIAERETGRSLKPSQVSWFWTRKALDFMFSSPEKAASLVVRKAFFFFNNYEFPDVLGMDFVAEFVRPLKAGRVSYGVTVIMAICGVLGYASRKFISPSANTLLVFAGGYFVSVMLFFVTARYRLPIVPFLIVFSAGGCFELIRTLKTLHWGALAGFMGAAVIGACITFSPVEHDNFATDYNSLAVRMENRGDAVAAERYYRKAIDSDQEYPSPYRNLGRLLERVGRSSEAQPFNSRYTALKKKYS